jgi:septum formation protein
VELLRQLGVPHQQRPVSINENPRLGEKAADYVQRIAREKARALWRLMAEENADLSRVVVLGADTTVHAHGEILGKPADEADFFRMLQRLSATTHQVLSAVALIAADGERIRLSVTEVRFKALTSDEITAYWRTGEPQDKAGGYAAQGLGAVLIEHLAGSYSGVVGLPLRETAEILQQAGVRIWQP